ncbi:MAG TPA: hypothetical protein PLL30_03660 [Candidatus Krumholzibacteria bacterium]|nr:hypothetical protein [Candidatus Krumholzibacteria bacterium]HPD70870.1 hypothetical protein [Candidatus Krumholzibacteria bacterium]HRY39430.1 hypothetical protein [Candidatus Krumholzibacteria bacterium]
MMRRALVPWLPLLVAATAGAQTAILRGRVVTLDGRPAPEARLGIVGHAAQLAIRAPSGEFEQALSGAPPQVSVTSLDDELAVLYPLDGLVPVPRDPAVLVTLVVGEPERESIGDLLAERLVALEATLAANGVRFDAASDSLSASLARVLGMLQLDEAELREAVVFQREQAATRPEILRTVDTYLRALADLRDGFRTFAPLARKERPALDALQRTMAAYDAAFTALHDNRHAYESQIRSYWPAPRADLLARSLADVYLEAVENIHRALVLPLNPRLVDLQRVHGADPPPRAAVESAVGEITAAADRIEVREAALLQRVGELREALARE